MGNFPLTSQKKTNQKRVLILGGTGEAAELTTKIEQIPGVEAIASFAGRTEKTRAEINPVSSTNQRNPVSSRNRVSTRTGGFGGVNGLVDYLRQERIDILIDVTHPFAAQISFNAAQAADECGIPRLMLVRPAWEKQPGDNWISVANNQAAAEALPGLAERIFLTIGRQELSAYAHLKTIWFLMRMIDPPAADVPVPPGKLLLERGPFSLTQERSLLQEYQIGAIVSKNSGGDATYAKIVAARELGIPVVMVQRPSVPEGEKVADVERVLEWLKNRC
ncbi:cobalt-precorrin-6A reductase [Planktothricoides sp. FACHB-1370]|nr:cobalt-precorrin-6X reductase [Planktothricoides sp. SR001]MBD2545477.1 cobalt-precorrin-6A reductase [Planktothricoides raciborskii FACHB-1370]MBD2583705.1 cobalt-precorrin-6A reductase [Planktothricoides raciborskii FACHB-1261]